MAVSIKPTPRFSTLGALADALTWLRDKGDDASLAAVRAFTPAGRYLTKDTQLGLGSLMLGKAPEEVNEWAYGNAPVQVTASAYPGIGSYVPQFKPGRAESTVDAIFGAQAGLPLAKAAGKAGGKALAKSIDNAMRGEGALAAALAPVAPAYAVKPKGGNWDVKQMDLEMERTMAPAAYGGEPPMLKNWREKQLRNYVMREMGTPQDPLLAVERENPFMHLGKSDIYPDGVLAGKGGRWKNAETEARHRKLLGPDAPPPTPWEELTGSAINDMTGKQMFDTHVMRNEPVPDWLRAKVWAGEEVPPFHGLTDDFYDLGFDHVRDYLGAATAPYLQYGDDAADFLRAVSDPTFEHHFPARDVADYRDLMNAGLALTPEQVSRTSVADAVRKTAQWNELLEANKTKLVQDDLSKGHTTFKEYYPEGTLYHGGSYRPGDDIQNRLYASTDKKLADSYVDMHDGRFDGQGYTSAFTAPLTKGADEAAVRAAAERAGIDYEMYTPASAFDHNLHDLPSVQALINDIRGQGYDHAVLPDVAFGVTHDGPATVLFPGTRTTPATPEYRWVKFGEPELPPGQLPEGWALEEAEGLRPVLAAPVEYGGHRGAYDTREAAIEEAQRRVRRKALRDGLNAEGDAMGHCVGGYCEQVANDGTEIYSLRDAKGQPHVTIEATPARPRTDFDMEEIESLIGLNSPYEREALERMEAAGKEMPVAWDWLEDVHQNHPNALVRDQAAHMIRRYAEMPSEIRQIKGKGNAAPIDKYLPYVQDFVKSGDWGYVGDLRNTGLLDWRDLYHKDMTAGIEPYLQQHGRYATKAQVDDAVAQWTAAEKKKAGYAEGGSVEPNSVKAALLARCL